MLERVRLLAAGHCRHPEALTLRGGPWRTRRFPAGFALLDRGRDGLALFDTGYSEHFVAATRRWPGVLYGRVTPVTIDEDDHARQQLAAFGATTADVRHIVVSHFHGDHVAALRDFPRATILCTRAAWLSVRRLRGLRAVVHGFLPELVPGDIETRLEFVDQRPAAELPPTLAVFGSGRDLFGDASALAVDLPGHAVGQIGAFVHASPQPMLLAADAAWSLEAVESDTPPPRVTTALLGRTRPYRATLSLLHAVHASASVRVVPSHCPRALGVRLG